MKKTLIILVLLVGFSANANELPKSLFGIPILDSNFLYNWISKYPKSKIINEFEYNGNKYKIIDFDEHIPKKNSEFNSYQLIIDALKLKIVKIRGTKSLGKVDYNKNPSEYKCTKEKEILVNNLTNFYSLGGFNNYFLQTKKEDKVKYNPKYEYKWSLQLADVSEISYPFDSNNWVSLIVSCLYWHENSSLRLFLVDTNYQDLFYSLDSDKVESLNFELLLTDFTGL